MRTALTMALSAITLLSAPDEYQAQRERLVRESMEGRRSSNPAVLKAMRETPRHQFMPPSVRQYAYEDRAVPIGYGQTISQPSLVALMTDILETTGNHRVLEIGTGSGYQAAVLSPLVKEIYTIEIVPELALSSAGTLKRLGYKNIHVKHGNGYLGWPDRAPFDRIILTAAPPELPKALVDQLAPGGKLVAPVGRSSTEQELIVVEKSKNGRISQRSVLPVRFVPMVQQPAVPR